MHLDIDTVERILHGEVDPDREPAILRHLEDCGDCAARVAEARRREARIFALFEKLDHPQPTARSGRRAARAERLRWRSWSRIAAGVALVVAAGGLLYALPGSPFREWLGELRPPVADAPDVSPAGASAPGDALSGLSIRMSAAYEIDFLARQESGLVRIAVVRSPELEIRVTGAPVVLESAPDRLIVSNAGSRSNYEIRLPSAGPAVRIRLEGVTVLRKAGGRVETVAARDSTGGYLLDLSRSPH